MYVYSGTCRKGDCGMPTGFVDMHDNELFVGDIVVTFTEGDDGVFQSLGGLSVVVSEKYTSYTDGTHVVNDGPEKFFVMGIKTAWPEYEAEGDEDDQYRTYMWRVLKVKDHSDVIDGEHWKDYGFNYKTT